MYRSFLNQGDQQQWPKTLITKLPNITKTPLSRIEPLLSTTEKEIMQPARNTRQSLSSTLGKPSKLRKLPTRNRKSRNSSVIRAVYRGPPRGGLQPFVMAVGRSLPRIALPICWRFQRRRFGSGLLRTTRLAPPAWTAKAGAEGDGG